MQEPSIPLTPAKKLGREFSKIRRRLVSRHLWFVRVSLLLVLAIFVFGIFALGKRVIEGSGISGYLSMANNFLFTPEGRVKSFEGRTNILLLGKAGDGVKNPTLTDTMIVLSVTNNSPYKVNLISIPRDIWVPELSDKINSAYYHGNEKEPGGGLTLTRAVVEEVVGMPVHYAMAVNFDGFVKVIDALGGVEVNVEKSFTDTKFPIPGKEEDECGGEPLQAGDKEFACRYETLTFNAGTTIMDGETALKFARSRHSDDPAEGNDLARTARQQKVILAIKTKIMKSGVLYSPTKLLSLWHLFKEITETDLTDSELAWIGRKVFDGRTDVASKSIPENLLVAPPYSQEYNNLYVFLPEGGDWTKVHDWVAGVLETP